MHHRDQVDQDTQVLSVHPDELVPGAAPGELLVSGPLWRGDGLYGLLQLLQHRLHALHLAHHQVVADLEHQVVHLQILLLLSGDRSPAHSLVAQHPVLNLRRYLLQQRIGFLEPLLTEEQHDLAEDEEGARVVSLVHECIVSPGLQHPVNQSEISIIEINQSEISIIMFQPIRDKYYNISTNQKRVLTCELSDSP